MTLSSFSLRARRHPALFVSLGLSLAVFASLTIWNRGGVAVVKAVGRDAESTGYGDDFDTGPLGTGQHENDASPMPSRSELSEGPESTRLGAASDDTPSNRLQGDADEPTATASQPSGAAGHYPSWPGADLEHPAPTNHKTPPGPTTTSTSPTPTPTTTTTNVTTTTTNTNTTTTTVKPIPPTTTTTAPPWRPTSPPVPGAVLFTRVELDSRQSLWRVESDGTGLRRLGWGGSPSWSPTKDRYAFEFDGEINMANADGSGVHRVGPARVDADTYDFETDWSPDGSRLAFIRLASNSSELWVVNTDGSGARPIVGANANGAASVRAPRWDRTGLAVRFTARLTPGTNSIGLESIMVDGPAAPSIVIQPTPGTQTVCYVESAGGQRQAYLFADAIFMTIRVEEAGRDRVEPFGTGTGLGCPRWANPDWLFSRVFDNGAHRLRFAHVDGRSFDVPDITDVYDATF